MAKQIIFVKGVTVQEFDYIADTIKTGLSGGDERIPVYSSVLEAEIDIIEIPDTDEKPMIVHNTHMGMQPTELRAVVYQVVMEVFKELNSGRLQDE